MAAINVTANSAGATVTQTSIVKVQASYSGPIAAPDELLPLQRVSPVFAQPTSLDAFGRPAAGSIVQTGEIVEHWGRIVIFVGGEDISHFRDQATSLDSISWQRLGNFETAEITIPGISVFETPGQGDLAWLTDSAFVRIAKLNPDMTAATLWLGTVNAINPGDDNIGIRLTAHGLFYDATYKVMKPPVQPSSSDVIEDLGYDIARAVNAAQGRYGALQTNLTGVVANKVPSWESGSDYIKSLLSLAVTDAGNSWTLWLDTAARPSLIQTRNIPGNKTVTLIAGQDGVEDQLSYDTVAGVTTIYGQGKTAAGAAWRNTKYPRATASKPRYPMDNPDEQFGEGATDSSTTTGSGVTKTQQALTSRGYTLAVNGSWGTDTTAAVSAFQKSVGLSETGMMDLDTWNRLYGMGNVASGAWIAPLATVSAVQPRLYDENGLDVGANPAYDPSIRPLEQKIDFGDGVSLAEAIRAAEAVIARDGERPTEGTISLTVCPRECARWDIMPGDTVLYKGHWGEDLELLVHRVSWSLEDTPKVSLSVSTRDMDYSELDAAINRLRKSSLSTPESSTDSVASVSMGVGNVMGSIPAFSMGSFAGLGGGGIKEVRESNSVILSVGENSADVLWLLDVSANSTGVHLDPAAPIGSQIHFTQVTANGPNSVLFTGSGIHSNNGTKLAGLWASCTAIKVTATDWILVGAMTT